MRGWRAREGRFRSFLGGDCIAESYDWMRLRCVFVEDLEGLFCCRMVGSAGYGCIFLHCANAILFWTLQSAPFRPSVNELFSGAWDVVASILLTELGICVPRGILERAIYARYVCNEVCWQYR